jgi:peptidyl-prolyl cis-trans isomerase-like 2
METAPVDPSTNRPKTEIRIKDVTVFLDPFEEFTKNRREVEEAGKAKIAGSRHGGDGSHQEDDDHITWTGKRVRGSNNNRQSDMSLQSGGVGKYLRSVVVDHGGQAEKEIAEFTDEALEAEHVHKKKKSSTGRGGFGNFEGW